MAPRAAPAPAAPAAAAAAAAEVALSFVADREVPARIRRVDGPVSGLAIPLSLTDVAAVAWLQQQQAAQPVLGGAASDPSALIAALETADARTHGRIGRKRVRTGLTVNDADLEPALPHEERVRGSGTAALSSFALKSTTEERAVASALTGTFPFWGAAPAGDGDAPASQASALDKLFPLRPRKQRRSRTEPVTADDLGPRLPPGASREMKKAARVGASENDGEQIGAPYVELKAHRTVRRAPVLSDSDSDDGGGDDVDISRLREAAPVGDSDADSYGSASDDDDDDDFHGVFSDIEASNPAEAYFSRHKRTAQLKSTLERGRSGPTRRTRGSSRGRGRGRGRGPSRTRARDHGSSGFGSEDDRDDDDGGNNGTAAARRSSERTMARLPTVPDDVLRNTLSGLPDPWRTARAALADLHASQHSQWKFELAQGFNLLFYGLGSKKQLVMNFAAHALEDAHVVVINGYFPSMSLRTILQTISRDVLKSDLQFRSATDHTAWLVSQFSPPAINSTKDQGETFGANCVDEGHHRRKLYLLVLSIDAPGMRQPRIQTALGRLAAAPGIHMAATVDHLNCALLWDSVLSARFNWIWHDATTFAPFVKETSNETSFLGGTGQPTVRSVLQVLRSLTPNARGIFIILARHQLLQDEPGTSARDGLGPMEQSVTAARNSISRNIAESSGSSHGLTFADLYNRCLNEFLVTNDIALRSQLTEFRDHRIIQTGRGEDGQEQMHIPLDSAALSAVLEQLGVADHAE